MLANIDPKERVRVILQHISMQFADAAERIKAGHVNLMTNSITAGIEMIEPLFRALEMLDEAAVMKFTEGAIKKLLKEKPN